MFIKNAAVIGVGGVGGYFGGKMCHYLKSDNGINIYFIARGAHLEKIAKNGLMLTSETDGEFFCHPKLATDNYDELPVLDLVLVCVKEYDLQDVILNISRRLHPKTIILPLLNGIDIKDRINNINSSVTVFPACVYVGTHVSEPGHVVQKGGACKIIFSAEDYGQKAVVNDLIALFKKSNINHELLEDVYPEIWKKFIFIAGYGLVTAANNVTVGQVLESREYSLQVKSVMEEIYKISLAQNIDLPDNIIETSYYKGHDFPQEAKTSFQRDFENMHKPDERDLFGGVIIRLGRKHNIDVPVTGKLYSKLNEIKPQFK